MHYAELMFIEGFFREYFLLSLIRCVLRFDFGRKKVITMCFLYGIAAVFYPIVPMTITVIDYLLIIPSVLIFCLKKTWKNILFFSLISVVLIFIKLPFVIVLCGIIFVTCLSNLPKKKLSSNENYYPCEIRIGDRKTRTVAFFDSGNRVFTNNGEPVVMADRAIYNRFVGAEEEICFSTLSGVRATNCRDGTVTVFRGGKRTEYAVKVALSPKRLLQCGLILHGDMSI